MFKTPGVERFVYLNDGRKLFLPRGPGGAVYLVPDLQTHLRLELRYTLFDKVAKIGVGVGIAAAFLLKTMDARPCAHSHRAPAAELDRPHPHGYFDYPNTPIEPK